MHSKVVFGICCGVADGGEDEIEREQSGAESLVDVADGDGIVTGGGRRHVGVLLVNVADREVTG